MAMLITSDNRVEEKEILHAFYFCLFLPQTDEQNKPITRLAERRKYILVQICSFMLSDSPFSFLYYYYYYYYFVVL